MKRIPLLLLLSMAACREESLSRARVPKEEAPAASAGAPAAMAPLGQRPEGMNWTLPPGWTQVAGNGMRLATLVPPGGLKTEVSIVALPGDSGGELANANRWRGQIGLPPTDEAGLASARTQLRTAAGPVKVYDFQSEGANPTRMIAAVVKTSEWTWFFKLTGQASATAAARGDFLTILKTLSHDAKK